MLFDPMPKENRKELFDRERELNALDSFTRSHSRIALVLGIRRVGKTSLLKVFVNESSYPWIFIDARRLSEHGYSRISLYRLLADELNKRKNLLEKIIDYLKTLRGISLLGTQVDFNWRTKALTISAILEKLDEYAENENTSFLVIVDEAQELRFLRGYGKIDFRKIISYCYDNLRRVKFILSGSEIGVLQEFIGFDDPESPLYGRAREIITVDRFDKEKSLEFLESGFREIGMNVHREILERAVDIFDGVPGWLTLYGYMTSLKRDPYVIDQVKEEAVMVALRELSNLARYSEFYKHVLKAIAMGYKNWRNIKYFVESHLGRPVYDQQLYRALENLVALSIIERRDSEYNFVDPLYREASLRM